MFFELRSEWLPSCSSLHLPWGRSWTKTKRRQLQFLANRLCTLPTGGKASLREGLDAFVSLINYAPHLEDANN